MSEYITSNPEIWKPIPGYEKLYEVSNQGRVKRLAHTHGQNSERVLKMCTNKYGYITVALQSHRWSVHVLVMLAFIGPRPLGFQINHIDGIKANNRLQNLEYVTPKENTKHAHRMGLAKQPEPSHPGETNGRAKLTENDVRTIRQMYANGATQVSLGKQFGVTHIAIGFIVRGVHWKHVK